MLEMLFWFIIKHFICDFPLQATPWMYLNKGTYGHIGGITHSAIHGIGTALICYFYIPEWWVTFALVDYLAHYHIDYGKVKVGRMFNLRPDNSECFWILLGFDQLLHFMTYFAFLWVGFK